MSFHRLNLSLKGISLFQLGYNKRVGKQFSLTEYFKTFVDNYTSERNYNLTISLWKLINHSPQLIQILHFIEHLLLLGEHINASISFLTQHIVSILYIIFLNDILRNLLVEKVPIEETLR